MFPFFSFFVCTLPKCKQCEKFNLKQLTQRFLKSCILIQSITGLLPSANFLSSMQKYAVVFFFLKLICDIFSSFVGIVLSTNLLTELHSHFTALMLTRLEKVAGFFWIYPKVFFGVKVLYASSKIVEYKATF